MKKGVKTTTIKYPTIDIKEWGLIGLIKNCIKRSLFNKSPEQSSGPSYPKTYSVLCLLMVFKNYNYD